MTVAHALRAAMLTALLTHAVAASPLGAAGPQQGTAAQNPPALPPAPEGVTIVQNVAYLGAGREEKLDLYLPADRPEGTRSPAVVIIHGGGWSGGTKSARREFNIGTTLAKAGYVCASIDYRLANAGAPSWPTNIHDCKNAVRFLRARAAQYGVDAEHLGVIGGSAGGHLALMVGYTAGVKELEPEDGPYPGVSSRVKAVVDMYGIADVHEWQATDEDGTPNGQKKDGSTERMLGGSRIAFPEKWKAASPVTYVDKAKTPPTLILHGTKDTIVDRDQATLLAKRLKDAGVEHRVILIEGIGHTFDLQVWNRKPLPQDLRPVVTEFFDRHLKPSEP